MSSETVSFREIKADVTKEAVLEYYTEAGVGISDGWDYGDRGMAGHRRVLAPFFSCLGIHRCQRRPA